jgi:hypothetical protein
LDFEKNGPRRDVSAWDFAVRRRNSDYLGASAGAGAVVAGVASAGAVGATVSVLVVGVVVAGFSPSLQPTIMRGAPTMQSVNARRIRVLLMVRTSTSGEVISGELNRISHRSNLSFAGASATLAGPRSTNLIGRLAILQQIGFSGLTLEG